MLRASATLLTAPGMVATAPIAIFASYFFLAFHTREYKELIVPTLTASAMACFCSGDRFTPCRSQTANTASFGVDSGGNSRMMSIIFSGRIIAL